MIKFDITNRWTGAVQFTAEIECAEDASTSFKLGLAVRWGLKMGANLTDANLTGAKWRNSIVISKQPIQLSGLDYAVTILDRHMQIGCELHALAEWETFDDRRIASMDGARSLRFWRDHKAALIALARGAGRSFDVSAPAPAQAAE